MYACCIGGPGTGILPDMGTAYAGYVSIGEKPS
jgi:hypothetical protein